MFRKTKPSDFARVETWPFQAPLRHVIYLKGPKPFQEGKRYRIRFARGTLPEQAFVCDSARLRSEAVHVSHLGFRPDDPAKVAFLSCWLGSGGRAAVARVGGLVSPQWRPGEAYLAGKRGKKNGAATPDEEQKKDKPEQV